MSEKIADLQLPMTCITRLIKEALPDNAQVKQEAKVAISKAASVFVLYLTSGKLKNFCYVYKLINLSYYSAVTDITSQKGQKTMSADHVLKALKEVEFDHMLPELESSLENYRKIMKNKKDRKSLVDTNENATDKATEGEVEADDDVEVIDD